MQFDFGNIPQNKDKNDSEYGHIGGVKYTPIQHVNNTGIFSANPKAFNPTGGYQ